MKNLTIGQLFLFIALMGSMLSFMSCSPETESPTTGTFMDERDRHEYKWVLIGTQTWMAENLAFLPAVSRPDTHSDTLPHYYVFRFEGTDVAAAKKWDFYSEYGVFYNWAAAMNGSDSSAAVPSGVRGVCPDGWHLPSDGEWEILINYLGGEYLAGKKMKSVRGWNDFEGESGKGDNSSGFNALPAGSRHSDGGFYNLGFNALYWSSTSFSEHSTWYRYLAYFHNGVFRYYSNTRYGFSVRCVKDED